MDASKINTQEQKAEQKPSQPVSLPKPALQCRDNVLTLSQQQEGGIKKVVDDVKAKFEHHTATPGPVIPQDFNVKEEGTKEERLAKTEALNK
jgi:hypothetical protein